MQKLLISIGMVVVVALVGAGIWFMLFGNRSSAPTLGSNGSFTTQNSQSFSTGIGSTGLSGQGQTQTVVGGGVTASGATAQKIFKIADGPVEDATFIQTYNPTTTLVRFAMQDSGHVLDVPIDIPGAVSRVTSNLTIPGIASALWLRGGVGVIMQYGESGVVKTLFLGLSASGATTSTKVRFLPDNISSIAASPDGVSVVYLLPSGNSTNGYIAKADGENPVKLFSSPLSQTLISWPSKDTLLMQTKEATGVPGIAFSVSALSGTMAPLVYAQGLSATANPVYSKVVYQTAANGTARVTYAHDVKSGKDLALPFNPIPEKCVWSAALLLYCAAPLASTPNNYLDLWHMGLYSAADSIFSFNIGEGITSLVALPGSKQGGVQADIATLHISPDGQYLLYVTKGDRSLWGVRLAQ